MKTNTHIMNWIRVIGLISLIIGALGLIYFDGYGFLFGILSGIGIGWLLTGKFIVMSKSEKEFLRK